MVKRTTPSRALKRKIKKETVARRKIAIWNRNHAKVVIGKKKFAVRVTCKGRIRMTRLGRKLYNGERRSLKGRCHARRGKRSMLGGRLFH